MAFMGIYDDADIYGPVQRAQAYREQQNALARQQETLARQQAVRNALSQAIDPVTGQTDWRVARRIGGTTVAPELQELEQNYLMGQAKLSHEAGLGRKARIDAETAYWVQQRDVAARIPDNDQASWSSWRSTLPAEFQQYVPEKVSPENKRATLTTADEALKLHFQQVDTGGGGYTLQMPEIGGKATIVPGSQFNKTLSPDQKARLDAETETGNYSDESINLMANLVAQGFPLPIPLGRGSKSDALKNTIYERAGRISAGQPIGNIPPAAVPGAKPGAPATPPTPTADVATNIGGARQEQAAVQAAIKYYSGGGQGQRVITSLNTAVDHLDTLSELSTALGNNDIKLFNRISQAWKTQTGQSAPTNFDAAKQIVAAEVIKAIVASGGGVTERQEAAEKISLANSPAQLAGVISTYQKLLAGQLESIGTQYKATTRRNDFDSRLSERTKRVLGRGKAAGGFNGVDTSNPLLGGTP